MSASKRYRLTMPGGRVVYVYEPNGGRPRLSSAALAARSCVAFEPCPIESEPVVVQDGRAAPGA